MRVLVAMSGGVDSSVAAALLHEQGHEVIGVTLHLWDAGGASQVGRCCAPEDRDDARRTCEHLGVPHYVIDERDAFRRQVVEPFVAENLNGRTPSPCVQCNQHVKLGRLWELAEGFGAEAFATGHYVRLERGADGATELLRGRDLGKDQSYFLFGVSQAVLRHLWCPLGELDKDAARVHARRLGLPNWNKPDSQELCFVPDGNIAGFVQARQQGGADPEGPIVDETGRELGRHGGIAGFTVGQRRGLGVATGAPRYVLDVIPQSQTVRIGPADALLRSGLNADQATWTATVPSARFRGQVRIRYRHAPAEAWVTPRPGGFDVAFDSPQRAVAPGQAAVIYDGDRVVGGGFIRQSSAPAPASG